MRNPFQKQSVPDYEVVKAEDVSTGVANRKKIYAVMPAADIRRANEVAVDIVTKTTRGGGFDVVFVFIYTDADAVERLPAPVRARWIRHKADPRVIPSLPWTGTVNTETAHLRKGRIDVAWEVRP